ncbi:MAG: hypothetical protein JWQ06_1957 [Mucilaginibacter sp.]|nr:hypothetical protein [Mucilaginibacter sp.]
MIAPKLNIMKPAFYKSVLLIVFTIVITSCNTKTKSVKTTDSAKKKVAQSKAIQAAQSDSTKSIASTDSMKTDVATDTVEVISDYPITPLPFGPPLLITYTFPAGWEHPLEDEYGKSKNSDEQAVFKVEKWFEHFYYTKSIKAPPINKIIHVKLGDDSLIINDKRQFKSGFKCRLSDIGLYQCYYWYSSADVISKLETPYDIGSLVLYNPKNEEATILNIYTQHGDGGPDIGNFYRYFFINKNYQIAIFEKYNNESQVEMRKSQEITIKYSGEISIKNFKIK